MIDALQTLKNELERLQADLAKRPINTMMIGEYRDLRNRERQLVRRIAQLEQKGAPPPG